MRPAHKTILRTASAALGATLMLCTGCASRPERRYLQSGLTGFIYGPIPEDVGQSVDIGLDIFFLTAPSPDEIAITKKLKTKKVSFDAADVSIEEFIKILNEKQLENGGRDGAVEIRVVVPPSWDKMITYDDATAKAMGYDKGFSESPRAHMPKIGLSPSNRSVYEILIRLSKDWPISFHFIIDKSGVTLRIADFQPGC